MRITAFLSHALLGLSLLTGASAFAQRAGGGAGAGGLLTADQRTKLRDALKESQTELTKLNEKLAAAQKEAINAALKDADEKSLRPKLEEVAKVQTEIALLRAKAVKEVASTLTDEQKSQIDSRPGLMYNALLGGFGGMGRDRAGRRGAANN